MKSILLPVLVLLQLLCFKSFSNLPKLRYILVEIPAISDRSEFSRLYRLLIGLEQVNSIQFCTKHHLTIINVKIPSEGLEKTIAILLKKSNYTFYFKDELPSNSVIQDCNMSL